MAGAVSAAASLVTSIIALMLEVDPTLDAVSVKGIRHETAPHGWTKASMWRNVDGLRETVAHGAKASASKTRGGNRMRTKDREKDPVRQRVDKGALTLDHYASVATQPDWTDVDRYRAIVCNLPRRLHGLDAQSRRRVLENAPPLTGTPWDALLAATAEHVARRHADPLPPWMNEPERFVAIPWFATTRLDFMRWEALVFTPAAFVRHGTPVHPSDLDARGGDEPWKEGR